MFQVSAEKLQESCNVNSLVIREDNVGRRPSKTIYVMRCAIWHHLYNLKNVKNTHGGVLILVKLQEFRMRVFVSLQAFLTYKVRAGPIHCLLVLI